ncbi:F-box/associated interaction domain protein [Arabidopsis thaliana]|uniref:F-box/associated interaction domain protein n=1 Tax=Arabidopsis thaliana TaxID=3702 RepID=F4IB23_ARATH|nr:F-box/associated interaction domain protein [Arabidopsis thaliana]AEE31937.1 F-box/associated interaction domain protein [Arabidopsis thaliana]|eukprot:NP_001154400.1 F-box/associated interaction domain protein [Arabidopsis thaliana]
MTKRKQQLSVVAYRSSGHPLFAVRITTCCSRPSLRLHRDKHSSLEATLHISSIATDYCQICPPVNGLVCRYMYGKDFIYVVVSNPITGENVTTPKVTTKGYPSKEKIYFGYDPVEEQFKQLLAKNVPSFALMFENAEEHKWSDTFYKMPEVLRPSRIESVFSAGMIGTGEVVLYRKYAQNFFYILYYNLEKNIITSVSLRVPGLDYVEYNEVHTFPDFVGELKLM